MWGFVCPAARLALGVEGGGDALEDAEVGGALEGGEGPLDHCGRGVMGVGRRGVRGLRYGPDWERRVWLRREGGR